jgi:nucleoid DNA-binding protein
MAKVMTKSELIQSLLGTNPEHFTRKDVKGLLEALTEIGYKELKKNGVFVLPGFAKLLVVKKPATKARKGVNPFTGEPTVFKAKPARKVVKARPVKAIKDAIA